MIDGRPQNNGMAAYFSVDGSTKCINSFTTEQDVSGWSYYLGQIDYNEESNGFGRSHMDNGSIFIGDPQEGILNKGKLYEL